MNDVVYDLNGIPVFPHLLGHYVAENNLPKVRHLLEVLTLDRVLVEAVIHENDKVVDLVLEHAKESDNEDLTHFGEAISRHQIDQCLTVKQTDLVKKITVKLNLQPVSIKPSQLVINKKEAERRVTVGQRRRALLEKAKFTRAKWQPNLNVFANDTEMTFKDACNILSAVGPQFADIMNNIHFLQKFNPEVQAPVLQIEQLKRQLRSLKETIELIKAVETE